MNQHSNFCLLFDTLNGYFSVLFGSTLIYLLTHLLITYLLTPWSRILLEKLTGSQLIKKFCAFYGTWRFITIFTRAWHLSLFWARLIQSMPCQSHFLKTHFNSTLPSATQFSKCFLSLRFPHQNPVCPSPLPSIRSTCSANLILYRYDKPNNISWGVQIVKLLIM